MNTNGGHQPSVKLRVERNTYLTIKSEDIRAISTNLTSDDTWICNKSLTFNIIKENKTGTLYF
jgi:hypothetical protein